MFKQLKRLSVLICICLYGTAASASNNATPFSIKNLNPFILVYGLPLTEAAELKTQHNHASAISLDIINNSIITSRDNEAISLDGETYRLAYSYRHGLNANTEIGLEVPWIVHNRGFMDNFIEGWHDTFGLSNTQRYATTSNSLNYQYSNKNNPIITIDSATQGIGDIRLFAAKQLQKTADSALSLHISLKLPSGDAKQLHGSGATDLSTSLAHIKRNWLTPLQLTSFTNAGLLYLGKGDVLSNMQNRLIGFGSAGLIWDNHHLIDLKTQLDFHSSIYDSGLDQLGSNTIQLTVGGSIHFNRTTRLDLGVGENLLTDTTPDFTINIVLKNNY